MATTWTLAHGSGVDELVGIAVPLVIVGGLWLGGRRRLAAGAGSTEPHPEDGR